MIRIVANRNRPVNGEGRRHGPGGPLKSREVEVSKRLAPVAEDLHLPGDPRQHEDAAPPVQHGLRGLKDLAVVAERMERHAVAVQEGH